jgi:hypothetical protein
MPGQRLPRLGVPVLTAGRSGCPRIWGHTVASTSTGARPDCHAVAINQPIRLEQIPGRLKPAAQRHHQRGQLPRHIPVVDHEDGT